MKLEKDSIIIRPLLTEKSISARERLDKYVFQVHKKANKQMVKSALETLYDVKVDKINILNVKSKIVRFRYRPGVRSGYKKAYVTLKEGTFEFFEGIS